MTTSIRLKIVACEALELYGTASLVVICGPNPDAVVAAANLDFLRSRDLDDA